MRLVVVESPYAGATAEEVATNVRYARACLADCLRRGEAPIASHLLYPALLAAEGTVRVPLTRGYETVIDAADAERVNAFKWLAIGRSEGAYAARNQRTEGRQVTVYLHRFLADCPPDMEVDHVNGDRLDNRQLNLRICKHRENSRNVRRRSDNASGFKGVSAAPGSRWRANIRIAGKQACLGTFDSAEVAARAYDDAALAAYGRFARTNFASGGVLDDTVPAERAQGIAAGLAWAAHADASVVYVDRGISRGMEQGIANAKAAGRPVEERTLGPDWDREAATASLPAPIFVYEGACSRCGEWMEIATASGPPSASAWVCSRHIGEGIR